MNFLRNSLIAICLLSATAFAEGGGKSGLGIHGGIGAPFVSQAGLTFYFSDTLGLDLTYNSLDLSDGSASVKLTMPELLVKYHPFSGAFFIGAGVGSESLEVVATDAATSQTASAEITATTMVGKVGWMWGASNGGFWFGVDVSFISPSGAEITITTSLPSTDQAYIDAEDAAEQFGKTAYTNITFARLGWIF